ncbi:MAG: PQQ-binding-like beta-propeller repeat protein, partial [Thermoguttaceae bacterium]
MRKTGRIGCLVVALVLLLSAGRVFAEDWAQWRGLNRDGISQETGLLKEWPKGGPKLLWQVRDLGSGYATPSVAGGRIYLLANNGLDDEFIKALDLKDGSQAWSSRLGKVGNPNQQPNFPAARSTPTVDGAAIYALSSDGDLACLETATGKVSWAENLRSDFGGKPGAWAYSESPLVDGEVVVVTPGGKDATLVALNKKTGDVVWKSAIPGGDMAGYASVVVAETGGLKQYLAYTAGGLVGVDAKTGKFLWRYDKTKGAMGMSILTPVVRGDLVYSGAGRVGGGTVKLTADQGTVMAEQAYFQTKLPTAIGGAVLVGDYLYGCGGQTLVCADFKTGQIKWSDRSAAPGALCYADGRLYLHSERGSLALVEATPEAYREHGRFTPPNVPQPSNEMEKSW